MKCIKPRRIMYDNTNTKERRGQIEINDCKVITCYMES